MAGRVVDLLLTQRRVEQIRVGWNRQRLSTDPVNLLYLFEVDRIATPTKLGEGRLREPPTLRLRRRVPPPSAPPAPSSGRRCPAGRRRRAASARGRFRYGLTTWPHQHIRRRTRRNKPP